MWEEGRVEGGERGWGGTGIEVGSDGFEEQLATHAALLDCAGETVECYERIDPTSVIFAPKGQLAGPFSPTDCCPALRETLNDGGYEVIYDGPERRSRSRRDPAGPQIVSSAVEQSRSRSTSRASRSTSHQPASWADR